MNAVHATAPRIPAAGEVLAGKYRVERVLGSGGHGVVLSATHLELGVLVAVKLLAGEAATHAEHLRRFKQEAKAAAALKSEHVVRILDYGTLEDATPFIVMEQLEGRSLSDLTIAELPVSDVVDFALQACESLAEAHLVGIVHRDIKPANLFLVRRPSGAPLVKVLDFGAAKVSPPPGLEGKDGGSTLPNTLIGSPSYMAPEQLKTSAVDVRADVYALGATMFELLTGQPVFDGDTLAIIFTRVLYEPPPSLRAVRPDVPVELENVLRKCLAKNPDDRFSSVRQLAAALAPFAPERSKAVLDDLGARPSAPPPPTSSSVPALPLRRRTGLVIGALAIGALTIAGVAHAVRSTGSTSTAPSASGGLVAQPAAAEATSTSTPTSTPTSTSTSTATSTLPSTSTSTAPHARAHAPVIKTPPPPPPSPPPPAASSPRPASSAPFSDFGTRL